MKASRKKSYRDIKAMIGACKISRIPHDKYNDGFIFALENSIDDKKEVVIKANILQERLIRHGIDCAYANYNANMKKEYDYNAGRTMGYAWVLGRA